MQLALDLLAQRWRNGRDSFVPPDTRIDPGAFGIEKIDYDDARTLIRDHHYLGTCPVPTLAYGLYRKTGIHRSSLVGCAVFGQAGVSAIQARTGYPNAHGLELTRFLLLDSVEFNGETWFLSRCLRAVRETRPMTRAILAHSDPTPRTGRTGEIVHAGHIGTIYAASSAVYCGRAERRKLFLNADGRVVPDRLFSKISRGKVGTDGGERTLVDDYGAPPRNAFEDRAQWLKRVKASGIWRTTTTDGVHAFVLPLNGRTRRAIETRHAPRIPYPRRTDSPHAA